MIMKQNEELNNILQLLLRRQLGKAIAALENYLLTYPRQQDTEQLALLKEDYSRMVDYWRRGFSDPGREAVNETLLRRAYVLAANMSCTWSLQNSPYMKNLYQQPRRSRSDWQVAAIREAMEGFVGDMALLQLEPEPRRQQRQQELYEGHQQLMSNLFDYVVTTRQWKPGLADVFIELLTAPTLLSNDQQLLVSAITMSAMQMFCMQKFRVLAEVYRKSTDELVRQRALVGWVLCADESRACLFTEMQQTVDTLLQDEATRQQLAELQMQLLYCTDADNDTHTIREEILPEIMNGSNLKMTKGGIVEVEEDSLEDILHPQDSELAMERMEQSVKRMADMQRQGADIYFGGFSQMKRFAFFNELSNWFVPFYGQHPAVSKIWNNVRGKKVLKAITNMGAFCDSDKYSFVLAYNQVLDRLPKNILQMIEQGEATAMPIGGEVDKEERQKPAYMRRLYLQNLYRFFRLFPTRSEFYNPFLQENTGSRILFFANKLFANKDMSQQAMGVARFLMKRSRYAEVTAVLDNVDEEKRDLNFYLLMGTVLQHAGTTTKTTLTAADCYEQALRLQPDNERALAGKARLLFNRQHYAEAQQIYERLLDIKPEHRNYQLNMAVCRLNMNEADEALKVLYKLSYENADDIGVNRILAWALTVGGKYEQAQNIYRQLMGAEQPEPTDMLNYGYCLWFMRDIEAAISMFRKFMQQQGDESYDLEREMTQTEHQLISEKGISDMEVRMMLDAI